MDGLKVTHEGPLHLLIPCLPCAQGRGIVHDYPCAVHSAGEGNASVKGNLLKKMSDFSQKGKEEEEI